MRKFLTKIALFSLGILFINFIVHQFLFGPAVFHKYMYNSKSIKEFNKVLLADSHGEALENAPESLGIFNFSYPSDNYLDMFLKLQEVTLYEIDTVFIGVDPHCFSSYRDNSVNLRRNLYYLKDDYGLILEKDIDSSFLQKKSVFEMFPIFDNEMGAFYKMFLKKGKHDDGDKSLSTDDENIRLDLQKRMKAQFPSDTASSSQIHYLNKIIDHCSKNQIQLIGIKFPVPEIYSQSLPSELFNVDSLFHSKGIPLEDCTSIFKNNYLYFRDTDHLNRAGAQQFIEKLAKKF